MDDEITVIRVVIPGTNVVRITAASACIGGGTTSSIVFSNPGGRLTVQSGVPVPTTDIDSTTIYYTPYKHNNIFTYSGSAWQRQTFSEISFSLASILGQQNYDVFINSSATALSLSAAWSSNTVRTDALGTQDGVTVLSSDHTKLWLGTIRGSGSGITSDSGGGVNSSVGGRRFVWNAYNQVKRFMEVIDTTSSWSYTSNTIRQTRSTSGNKVEYVTGEASQNVVAGVSSSIALLTTDASTAAKSGVGVDTTTAFSGTVNGAQFSASDATQWFGLSGYYSGMPGLGYHYLSWNEAGISATTSVFVGNLNAIQSGLTATGQF